MPDRTTPFPTAAFDGTPDAPDRPDGGGPLYAWVVQVMQDSERRQREFHAEQRDADRELYRQERALDRENTVRLTEGMDRLTASVEAQRKDLSDVSERLERSIAAQGMPMVVRLLDALSVKSRLRNLVVVVALIIISAIMAEKVDWQKIGGIRGVILGAPAPPTSAAPPAPQTHTGRGARGAVRRWGVAGVAGVGAVQLEAR